jgi:hypothetical protein
MLRYHRISIRFESASTRLQHMDNTPLPKSMDIISFIQVEKFEYGATWGYGTNGIEVCPLQLLLDLEALHACWNTLALSPQQCSLPLAMLLLAATKKEHKPKHLTVTTSPGEGICLNQARRYIYGWTYLATGTLALGSRTSNMVQAT